MALEFITADQRMAYQGPPSFAIFGRPKIGKTTLATTLDPDSTLLVNMEAGLLSLGSWKGDVVNIRSYEKAVEIVCLIGGVDPGAFEGRMLPNRKGWEIPPSNFCPQHYQLCVRENPQYDGRKYKYIFFDSVSKLTEVTMDWAKTQPQAWSEKTGKPDTRGAYGLVGQSVIKLVSHLHHTPGKGVIFVGGLDVFDDDGIITYKMQSEGAKTSSLLPYVVDQIITYSDFDVSPVNQAVYHSIGKGERRLLVCKSPNMWGLPAGDRSGKLALMENPDLGAIIKKIMT